MAPSRRKPKSIGGTPSATDDKKPSSAQPVKTFKAGTNSGLRGRKILMHAASGMGKTSLAVMAPKPIIIPIDDGSCDIRDPFTHKKIQNVLDCHTFGDTRSALQQYSMYDPHETVIVDTITKLQDLSHVYMFQTIKHEKGHTVSSIEGYGFGKGYRHLYDTMKLLLMDADELIRRGKNVIFIAQSIPRSIPNAAGEDYLCNSPRLYPGSKNLPSVEAMFCEWADDVLFINHANAKVAAGKIKGAATRAVFAAGELHFKAKTRVLEDGSTIPAVISFDAVNDDSLWLYLFEGGCDEEESKESVPADTVPPE
jgi:hypothetical protein